MESHTVRVSDENLELLKQYKEKLQLPYNDIIGLALKSLDGKEFDDAVLDSPVYQIKVSLNRVKINEHVRKLLNNGYDLFIPDITHRQAMYIKRKLRITGFDCDYIKSDGDGKHGFLFSVHQEPKPRVVEEQKKIKNKSIKW